MDRCATCGYFEDVHEGEKCPVCACGDAPAQHEQLGDELRCACGCEVVSAMHMPIEISCPLCDEELPHACVWARWLGHPCPGRRSSSEVNAGKWLVLRQGKYKSPATPEPRREWFGLLVPVLESEVEQVVAEPVTGPPQVPARPPIEPTEFAGTQGRQARGLGRKALAAGWDVSPWYWRAFDGAEGCAVRLARGPLRAVATWKRAPGHLGEKSGWAADVAYGWRTDVSGFPTKLTVTQLEGLIS